MLEENIVSNFDIKVLLLAFSIVISNAVTIFLYLKNRRFSLYTIYSERLFKIQDISFRNPYLEDRSFIEGWDSFCSKYKAKEITDHEDSFVHTLANYFRQTGATVTTVRTPVAEAVFDSVDPDLVVLAVFAGQGSGLF